MRTCKPGRALACWGALLLILLALSPPQRPTVYLIGDSTVRNGRDRGDGGLWGWGHFLDEQFDTRVVHISNRALGGTSSRTYLTRGLWDSVLARLRPGDYVLMQFGHNDGGPLDDTARARGTLKGNGDETREIYNPLRKTKEVVHTYGWYLRRYIRDARARHAVPIVCSPIPRNLWKDGRVLRSDYAAWAKAAALEGGAPFIDLNDRIAKAYDSIGEATVRERFFGAQDHTHTLEEGARFNARIVAEAIRDLHDVELRRYLKK